MAKKEKTKASIIEEIQFKDLERAQKTVKLAKINNIRILIGFVLSVIATFLTLKSYNEGGLEYVIGDVYPKIFAFLAYLIGGGILNTIKTAWGITKFGWFVIPFFPIDLIIAFFCFLLGLIALFHVPVFFVGLNFLKQRKTLAAAEQYLAESARAAAKLNTTEEE